MVSKQEVVLVLAFMMLQCGELFAAASPAVESVGVRAPASAPRASLCRRRELLVHHEIRANGRGGFLLAGGGWYSLCLLRVWFMLVRPLHTAARPAAAAATASAAGADWLQRISSTTANYSYLHNFATTFCLHMRSGLLTEV
jgi:hypothetical protein